MKLNLSAVDGRKEVATDQREHHPSEDQQQNHRGGNNERVLEQFFERPRIGVTHRLEAALERRMKAGEQAPRSSLRRTMVFILEQQADGDRRQGARQTVRGQHCEHDCQSQWREQIFCRAVEEHHRGKDAADGKRRNQRRHGDAGRSMERGLRQRLPFFRQQAVSVLDRDRRIVDQDSDRECKSAERHGINRIAEEI